MVWQEERGASVAATAEMVQQMEQGMTRENQELSRRKAEHMEAVEHIAPQHGFDDYNSLRASRLTDKTLREYFHLPLSDVAKRFGMCTTAFKKLCRKEGIMQWPYRTLRSLEKKMASLRAEQKFTHDQFSIEDQIAKMQAKREAILAGTGLNSLSEDELSSPSHIPSDDSSTSGSTSSINSAERSCSASPRPAQLMNALAISEGKKETSTEEDRIKYRRMVSMSDMDRYSQLQPKSGGKGGGGDGSRAGPQGGAGASAGARKSSAARSKQEPQGAKQGSAPAPPTRAGPPLSASSTASSSSSSSSHKSVKRSASFPKPAERPPFPAPAPYGAAWPQHVMGMPRAPGEGGEGGPYGRGGPGYGFGLEGFLHRPPPAWTEDPVLLQQRFHDLAAENMSLRNVIRSMALEREQLARQSHSEEAELAQYQVKTEMLGEMLAGDVARPPPADPKAGRGRGQPAQQRPRTGKGRGGGRGSAPAPPPAPGGGPGAAVHQGSPQHGPGGQRGPGGQGRTMAYPLHQAGGRPGGQQHFGYDGSGMGPTPQQVIAGHDGGEQAAAWHPHQGQHQHHHQQHPQQHGAAGAREEGHGGHVDMEFDGGAFLHGEEGFLGGSPPGMELWTDGGHHDFGV